MNPINILFSNCIETILHRVDICRHFHEVERHNDGLAQDSSIFSMLGMKILQSCTKLSIWYLERGDSVKLHTIDFLFAVIKFK